MTRPKKPKILLRFRTKSQQERIQRAARIRERGNVTQFILEAAERRAEAVIAEHETAQAAIRESQAVAQ